MSNSRVDKIAEFHAISLTGEAYTVEEYAYFEFNANADNCENQWTPYKKMHSLRDERSTLDLQPVDHVSGNDYKIRRDGLIITRRS